MWMDWFVVEVAVAVFSEQPKRTSACIDLLDAPISLAAAYNYHNNKILDHD